MMHEIKGKMDRSLCTQTQTSHITEEKKRETRISERYLIALINKTQGGLIHVE